MKLQQLYSYVRQAIDDYQMIADGDRIAVGISGGKDSLTLLYALSGLRRFYPKKFVMYVPEANVIGFLHKYHLPLVKNPCPADGETKREYVKQLVRQINLENPGVKKRIFHAICTGRMEGWNINGKQ